MSGRTSRRAGWRAILCLGLALGAAPSARAQSTIDELAALTGLETPASQALDKEAQKLLAERLEVQAQVRERIAKRQPVGDLSNRMSELVRAAYAKAEAAADERAKAALEQRRKPLAAAAGPGASPRLCAAVAAGGAERGENDFWTVAACVRQYLAGLKEELDALRARTPESSAGAFPRAARHPTIGSPTPR
jgi:hypothetical protein